MDVVLPRAELIWNVKLTPATNRLLRRPANPIYTPHACSGVTSIACSPVLRIPRAGGGAPWSAIRFAAVPGRGGEGVAAECIACGACTAGLHSPARSLPHAYQRRLCRSAAARRAGGSRGVRAGVPRRLRASVGRRFPYIEQQGARRRGVAGGFHECVAQRGRVRWLGGGLTRCGR